MVRGAHDSVASGRAGETPGMDEPSAEVCVVGAGLAGLAWRGPCTPPASTSACSRPPTARGRVRTDLVDGFRVDRGFQVVLTAYPELARQLDVDALDLQAFDAVRSSAATACSTVGDPVRHPDRVLSTLRAPIGSTRDKLRVLGLAVDLRRTSPRALLRRPDRTVRVLEARGFSGEMIDALWQPLLAGILLDPSLDGSARKAEVILAMLARVAPPSLRPGWRDLAQLAGIADAIELDTHVVALTGSGVRLAGVAVDARWPPWSRRRARARAR